MNLKQLMNATNVETLVVVRDQAGKTVFNWAPPLEVEEWATANMVVMSITPIFYRDDTPFPAPAMAVTIEERDQLADQLREENRDDSLWSILAEFSEDYTDDVKAVIMAHADGWAKDARAADIIRAWKRFTERARERLKVAAYVYAGGGDGADQVRMARYSYNVARALREDIYTVLISPAMAAVRKGGGGA